MRAQTPEERSAVLRVSISLAGAVLCALGCLLWRGQNAYLLLLGAISAAAFAAQALVKKLGRKARMHAQMIGALGLTSTAPAAYYVISGSFDHTAWALWFANWLFASDQIHFVQLRIHAARAANNADKLSRGRGFLVGQAVLCAVLLLSSRSGLLPSLALVAFLPVLLRGLVWFFQHPRPLAVRRLGWQELAQASVFASLLVFSFRWGS